MRLLSLKAARILALLYAAGLGPAAQAHASTIVLMNSQMLALFQAISVPNLCVTYSYDLNGNRMTQNSVLYGSPGTTWGSAVYGCFSWTS